MLPTCHFVLGLELKMPRYLTLGLISFQGRRPSYRAGPIGFRQLATVAIVATARIDE